MSDSLAVLMPGFAGTELPAWVEDALERGLGGVCLFADNIASPEQVRALTDAIYAANPEAIVAVDEEGGDVTRLFQRVGSPYPGNAILGRIDDLDLTRAIGAAVGDALAAVGIGMTLAPDVDVNSNPLNPVIGVRSFGPDVEVVARHGLAWVEGLRSAGVAGCVKHFPGHGDTSQDSHLALPVVDADAATLDQRELVPFRTLADAGVESIMTSHIVVQALDPDVPATFSRRILTELLRDDWGFRGVVVTDALDMAGASAGRGIPAAAVAAISAGADLLCLGPYTTEAMYLAVVDAIAATGEGAATDRDAPAREVELRPLSAAAGRVRALGRSIATARSGSERNVDAASLSAATARVAEVTPEARVQGAFTIGPGVRELLASDRPRWVVAIQTEANIAVGDAPWGPFALGLVPDANLTAGDSPDDLLVAVPDGALMVVIGIDLHRRAWTTTAVDTFRRRDGVIVVDMGWPALGTGAPDIATYGAARPAARALLDLIGCETCE